MDRIQSKQQDIVTKIDGSLENIASHDYSNLTCALHDILIAIVELKDFSEDEDAMWTEMGPALKAMSDEDLLLQLKEVKEDGGLDMMSEQLAGRFADDVDFQRRLLALVLSLERASPMVFMIRYKYGPARFRTKFPSDDPITRGRLTYLARKFNGEHPEEPQYADDVKDIDGAIRARSETFPGNETMPTRYTWNIADHRHFKAVVGFANNNGIYSEDEVVYLEPGRDF